MGIYVSLDEIYEKSTLLVFHCPFTKENFHMVNGDSIRKMRTGVVLVNRQEGDFLIISCIRGLKRRKDRCPCNGRLRG